MVQTDGEGVSRSYLASEASFAFLKDLESRNLVVPVVGDFGGPKAIRSIGAYLKAHDATVAAFYLSNVEQYLLSGRKVGGVLPERGDAAARRARAPSFARRPAADAGFGGGFVSSLGSMAAEVERLPHVSEVRVKIADREFLVTVRGCWSARLSASSSSFVSSGVR